MTYLVRAQHLAQAGRYVDAEREARAGLAVAPADARLLTLLASVQRLRRDYGAALASSEAAVSAAPWDPDAHIERAEILILLLRPREAVTAAREAVRLAPHDADGHLTLARALGAARRLPEARASAAYALELAPGSVEALLTVADVEREAGNREAATLAARAALAVSPGNPYGRWLIAMLDAEGLNVRRSMRGLRDVARDHPARPDVLSLTWPVRGVLDGLRRGLAVGGGVVVVLVLLAFFWPPSQLFARVLAAAVDLVLLGFAARILIPAGRLPWRCLRLLPPLTRRASLAGMAVLVVAIGLLAAFVLGGAWQPAIAALLTVPVLWICHLLENLGPGGFRAAARRLRPGGPLS